VPVAPAVGEPLPKSSAGQLPAQLGPEPAAGFAGAAGDRAFDVAELGVHVSLQGARERGHEVSAEAWQLAVRAIGAMAARLS
jgi:hypothetical protein